MLNKKGGKKHRSVIPIHKVDYLIVGSGAGAVGLLSELIRSSKRILMLEQGSMDAHWGQGVSERGRRLYRENGKFPESLEGIGYYRHMGVGGTVQVSCANGVRPPDSYLTKLGVNIQAELDQVGHELQIEPLPASHMGENTRTLAKAALQLNLKMVPTPKFIDFKRCRLCAQCELICLNGAVWSTFRQLEQFRKQANFTLLDNARVNAIDLNGSKALAVQATIDGRTVRIEASRIILAAGGLGTPVILQNSGIKAGGNLHLDLYTVVYGRSKAFSATRDIPMATVYQHPGDAFIIAPYIDIDIWHCLNHNGVSKWFGQEHMAGLMVKIADEGSGHITQEGIVHKKVTEHDQHIFEVGIEISKQILQKAGVSDQSIMIIKPRGAHPGGTAAIRQVVDSDLKVKGYDNLFVADASVLPVALGKPPILTIMALAKRLGKLLLAA